MATLFVAPIVVDGKGEEGIWTEWFGDELTQCIVATNINERNSSVVLEFNTVENAKLAQIILLGQRSNLVTKIKPIISSLNSPVLPIPVAYTDDRVPQGLILIPDFISLELEKDLLAEIDSQPWDTRIKRRVQHYGFAFQYSKLKVDESIAASPFPELCASLLKRDHLKDCDFNQLTINEYVPGTGIASHCDTHSAFSDTIGVVSICGSTVVDYVSDDDTRRVSVVIPARSLYLMTEDSRYGWRHAIAARKTDRDTNTGELKPRDARRISLTFRKCVSVTCTCKFKSLCDSQGADLVRPRRLQEG